MKWCVVLACFLCVARGDFAYEAITAVLSRITIRYADPLTKQPKAFTAEIGRYAGNTIRPAAGILEAAVPPRDHPAPVKFMQG